LAEEADGGKAGNGHGHGEHWTADDIASGQRDAVLLRGRVQAAIELEGILDAELRRQEERDQAEVGDAAHGGDIAEVDRQRFPPNFAPRASFREEVDAGDQGVRCPDDRTVRAGRDGGVVAEANEEAGLAPVARRGVSDAERLGQKPDQSEFAYLRNEHG